MADGVPLEIGVAKLGREGVDHVRAVIVDPAAAVSLRKFSCITKASERLKRAGGVIFCAFSKLQPTQLVVMICGVSGAAPKGSRIREASL